MRPSRSLENPYWFMADPKYHAGGRSIIRLRMRPARQGSLAG